MLKTLHPCRRDNRIPFFKRPACPFVRPERQSFQCCIGKAFRENPEDTVARFFFNPEKPLSYFREGAPANWTDVNNRMGNKWSGFAIFRGE